MNALHPALMNRLAISEAGVFDRIDRAVASGDDWTRARASALIAHATSQQRVGALSASERQTIDGVLRLAAAVHMARSAALSTVLAAFAAHGLRTLVLKGAAHAALYPAPYLRSRSDDDILVAPVDFDCASEHLRQFGYARAVEVDAGRITGQRHYARDGGVVAHHVDLHGRILNAAAFATLPTFDELWSRRQPLGEIEGFSPGRVDALLLAAAHRVAHHPRSTDVLWSIDMHLLASTLHPVDWDELCSRAHECGVALVVAAELEAARARWETSIPDGVLSILRTATGEASAAYLDATGTLSTEWLNFCHQRSFTARLSVLREHVFPSPSYMRRRYGTAGPLRLAWLYVWRASTGGVRWMREHHAVRRGV
jgi:hypothetical protein